jgi:hypothetical protein
LKLPSDVRLWFARRYASLHRQWLHEAVTGQPWQQPVTLGIPTEAAALHQAPAVRAWADAWRDWRGPGQVAWAARRWKTLGVQQLPATLQLDDIAAAADWIGERERWQTALARSGPLVRRWPALTTILARLYDTLADYSDIDFQRLQDVLDWLQRHATSALATGLNTELNVYPRQLPLAGMDSKWFEARSGVLALMLATLRGDEVTGRDLYTLAGLRRPPPLLRMRILDPVLRAVVGGVGDLAAPVDMLAALSWQPSVVIIVENLQTGLALQDLPGAVAIMGLGYAVGQLATFPWLAQAHCMYWGDIDTHGYAILHRARQALPHLVSVLMDEATLLNGASLWVQETAAAPAVTLHALTVDEHAVYDGLRHHRWGQAVRLEQERIAWDVAWAAVVNATPHGKPESDPVRGPPPNP